MGFVLAVSMVLIVLTIMVGLKAIKNEIAGKKVKTFVRYNYLYLRLSDILFI